ncbi:methylated-DNA-[protein]-cysteine S-methyltransferase [Kribbella aluminosa]|uniref:Methylated-DNA-[protein]-cysteine S-methyltransferase n=1 Tax=Kribbella aluminosa TaxID=416017 RepID=A0ABS4UQV2_9ACTN|nr:methylated-DNA-[protein]-cysteine S-methyltransferase [Kribbella aluminosa]
MTDLESRLTRLNTPDPKPPVFPDADVAYTLHDTPIGTMLLAVAYGKVVASSFGDEETITARLARSVSPRVLRQPRPLDDVRRQLDEYLDGRRHTFDLDVDLVLASPFQRLVLEDLPEHTSYGRTTTYGAVAVGIDKPKAAPRGRYGAGREPGVRRPAVSSGDRRERRTHRLRGRP